jgi:hypothetical protein
MAPPGTFLNTIVEDATSTQQLWQLPAQRTAGAFRAVDLSGSSTAIQGELTSMNGQTSSILLPLALAEIH